MFFGSYTHQVDAKNRIRIPTAFKSEFGGRYAFRVDEEGVLSVYPADKLQERYLFLNAVSPFDKEAGKLISIYLSGFYFAEDDPQGRVMIPKELRDKARLKKDIVIMSSNDHVNIVSKETFDKLNASVSDEEVLNKLDDIYKKYVF